MWRDAMQDQTAVSKRGLTPPRETDQLPPLDRASIELELASIRRSGLPMVSRLPVETLARAAAAVQGSASPGRTDAREVEALLRTAVAEIDDARVRQAAEIIFGLDTRARHSNLSSRRLQAAGFLKRSTDFFRKSTEPMIVAETARNVLGLYERAGGTSAYVSSLLL
jgi:hypothetical protein